MKSLIDYIKEEIYATPGNTIGMGGITAPEGDTPGSGDIPGGCAVTPKKKKRFKRYKVDVKKSVVDSIRESAEAKKMAKKAEEKI